MKRTLLPPVISAIDIDESITVRDFCKSHIIYKAIVNMVAAWNEMKSRAMNGVWKRRCPQFVNDFKGFENFEVNKTLVQLSEVLEWYWKNRILINRLRKIDSL